MKKVLITGGAGFVGSSLAVSLKRMYPSYVVYCLDNLKRRGSELNLERLKQNGIQFIHGDIRNAEDFGQVDPDTSLIIDASAEPSVMAGIDGTPDYLINTNLGGTINCLNVATRLKADFIFLSTSRVYPIASIEGIMVDELPTRFSISATQSIPGVSSEGISENFPLDGYRSFYGATKLASEYLIKEYTHFYGIRTVINRCGVIAGPWQMGKVDQGVVGLWVARHFWKKNLSYIGYGGQGKQVRDILHPDDLFQLVDYQMHHMDELNGSTYNVGGGEATSVSLKELTALCQEVVGNKVSIEEVKETRQADIRIYITNNSLVTRATRWKPSRTAKTIVADTFNWIRENERTLKPILAG
jgi:CDP-paratose 2-epimerase